MIQPYDEFNVKTGKKIRKMREELEYTRDYLAEKSDISSKFLYEIEIGKKGCSSYILYRLAISLGVRVDSLIAYDGTEYEAVLETDLSEEMEENGEKTNGADSSDDCGRSYANAGIAGRACGSR